jgi:hypothetical protein
MARIRSIKPELRTSLTAVEWPREVRYLWVLLWGYLDDHGRGVDNARLVLADCFPLDRDLDEDTIDKWLTMFAESGPLCRYTVAGRRYFHSVNWKEHQRPSHPTDSRIPPCPHHHAVATLAQEFPNDSGETRESLANSSGSSREMVTTALTSGNEFANSSGEAPEVLAPEQLVRGVVRDVVREGGAGGVAPDGAPPVAAKRAGKPRTPATEAPDHIEITDSMYGKAKNDYGLSRQRVDFETGQFLNHHRARGNTFKDWKSAWHTWMGRVRKYDPQGAQTLPIEPEHSQERPPWCGLCNERTRMVDDADHPEHCPRCHPSTQKADAR